MTRKFARFTIAAAALTFLVSPRFPAAAPVAPGDTQQDQAQVDPLVAKGARVKAMNSQMRISQAQRDAAAKHMKTEKARLEAAKAAARAKGIDVPKAGIRGVNEKQLRAASRAGKAESLRTTSATALLGKPNGLLPTDVPDYFTSPNWSFSQPLRKFVDTLPLLGPGGANTLGNFLPVAHPDTTTYPGSDYYVIEVREYTHQFHRDLPATHVRGYVQVNNGTNAATGLNTVAPEAQNWLGPIIVATKDRPVRILFRNKKTADVSGGHLPSPVDETIMGAGMGPLTAAGATCDWTPTGAGMQCAKYPESRSAIHLHGGRTPWISDGTPHQWILPAADYANPENPYKMGVSLFNVPDMPAPAADETTYYWSNQQSARLMFYHDHAWGITRLNVLMGEAAGIVLTDATEQQLIAERILPDVGIPLVIQDRSFVDASLVDDPNNPGQKIPKVRVLDPTWNYGSGAKNPATGIVTPVTGDFWQPHVYEVAENPADPSGFSAYGRWVYGPWFYPPTKNLIFPPIPNPYHDPNCSDPDPLVFAFCTTPLQPSVIPATPNPSVGAETFFDTMMVNGQVFPYLEVEPRGYRFRVLNAANDRFVNLNIYEVDPAQPTRGLDGQLLSPAVHDEVAMCAIPGATPPLDTMCWDAAVFPNWPADGRVEGVPNPNKLGPKMTMIGTEGGFLAKPTELTGQPMTWVTDPTLFTAGNIDLFNLFLGPAQRADILVDFAGYEGKGFILYNDAPAAVPAFDPRFDYHANAPDMSDTGGYGEPPPWDPAGAKTGPVPGYGPGTRTVMKIKVKASAPAGSYHVPSIADLTTRWLPGATPLSRGSHTKGVFDEGQDPIIVGQAAYNGVYAGVDFPEVWPYWGLARIEDNYLTFKTVAGAIQTFPMEPKAMHDEMGATFDPEYGRMITSLGMRTPIPTAAQTNVTMMPYFDVPTEVMNSALEPISPVLGDGTQIWKISHNGVDMHPIHFHIFDVQLVNRVGWDGLIAPPPPTEALGWQDTVRIAPLQDTIVAMRPWAPPLPFGVPDSNRPLNPAIPIGNGYGFTNIDPVTQQPLPTPTLNAFTNFAWEYVWHCHILSHEENDMMRPIIVNVQSTVPPAIAAPTVTTSGTHYKIDWVDPTPVNYVTQSGFHNSTRTHEIGFKVERKTSVTAASWTLVGTVPANTTTYTDASATTGTWYRYRVTAYNAAGSTSSPYTDVGSSSAVTTLGSVNLSVSNVQSGITSSQWTKGQTTAASPFFFAQGRNAANTSNVASEYQFSLQLGGGAVNVVQSWSPVQTWIMPLSQAGGGYTVKVEARTSPAATIRSRTMSYTVSVPAAVTSLALTPSVASPATVGTNVVFTATPTGGSGPWYRFSLNGVVVRDWSATSTWTLDSTNPVGNYTVLAEVRTNSTSTDTSATVSYDLRNPPATGVALAREPAKALTDYAPVKFLATGAGPAPLTTVTGGGYYYRFLVAKDGGAFVEKQAYGTARVYTLPHSEGVGSYVVKVQVKTSLLNPAAAADAEAVVAQSVIVGATVSFSSILPASPQVYGARPTFTAVGSGGTGGPYLYRFTLDGGAAGAWSSTSTYTLPAGTSSGTHSVKVEISDELVVPVAEGSATASYVIEPDAATGVSFTSILPASPQAYGTAATFTAAGSGAADPAAVYKYRFTLDGGTPTAWSTTNTYPLPGTTAVGTHTVKVDVTTEATPATVQATSSSSYVVNATAASGVSFSSILPANPTAYGNAVTFTAAGTGGGTGATYQYRFKLDSGSYGAWSTTATYTLPGTTLAGTYTVTVDVSTAAVPSTAQATATSAAYTINYPIATGVSFTSISPASPGTYGTATTFTAAGSSSIVLPAGAYKYRFLRNFNGGAFSEVQAWSTTATYSLASDVAVGSYVVRAEVSTVTGTPLAAQATADSSAYVRAYPAATGVSFTSVSPASPQLYGTAVTFTAAGSSSIALPAGAYKYRFSLDGTVAQDWSTTATYTMPGTTPVGTHTVKVDVTTEATPATVQGTVTSAGYTISAGPATGVSFTSISPASPQVYGTTVTFTATGTGGSPGATYQYRFKLDGGTFGAWTTNNVYTFPMDGVTLGGTRTVTVETSTAASPISGQATATSGAYIITYPMATAIAMTPTLASPVTAGQTVTWNATASSSRTLPASAYSYRFWYQLNGGPWIIGQDYGRGSSWTWAGWGAGSYRVQVQVRTTPYVDNDVQTSPVLFIINPANSASAATGVSLAPSLPSPVAAGTSVTWTAVGSGATVNGVPAPASSYDYRFWYQLNGGPWIIGQDYGRGSSWTWAGWGAGSYRVQVQVRTTPYVDNDVQTGLIPYVIQ